MNDIMVFGQPLADKYFTEFDENCLTLVIAMNTLMSIELSAECKSITKIVC